MRALTACQTAFLPAVPSSFATVYSLPIAVGIVRQMSLKCPVAPRLMEHRCRVVSLVGALCDCTHQTTAGVHPSVTESKRGWRERRKRAELASSAGRGDDDGGKGGGHEEKQRNVFS